MPKKKPNVDDIHDALRRAAPVLEDKLTGVLFDYMCLNPYVGGREMGHEILAIEKCALRMIEIGDDALKDHVNINLRVHHAGVYKSRPKPENPTVNAEGHALPGHGNTTRALDPVREIYSEFTWDKLPQQVKETLRRNTATLISLNYRNGSPMVSMLRLHGGETLTAIRKNPGEHSDGYRGDVSMTPLLANAYRINPNKAIRIILPNYLGSVANEEHFGAFKRAVREYCQEFGKEGLDVSFDGADWNTACDIGSAIVVRHQANGYVDIRNLTPNINPNRDARLLVSDIKVPAHIVETIDFFVGTTNEEPLNKFHNMNNSSESLDAMLLADDLINGKLGFDFREAILEGRLAFLRAFYKKEGKSIPSPNQIQLDGLVYSFNRKINSNESLTVMTLNPEELQTNDSFEVLNNAGVYFFNKGEYLGALKAFGRAREIIEGYIKGEMTIAMGITRNDYSEIIRLRKFAAAIYFNLAKTEYLQYDTKHLMSAKHYADLAVLYNPHNFHFLSEIGDMHANFDQRLLDVDEKSALRRARIFYRYAIEQINSDIQNERDASGRDLLEQEKYRILNTYIPILQGLVSEHPKLEEELSLRNGERDSLKEPQYSSLRVQTNTHGRNFCEIKTAIETLEIGDSTRADMISSAIEILKTKNGDITNRALIVWATSLLHDLMIEDVIGEGAYGVVYKGHTKLVQDEKRAIKIIDAIRRTRQYIDRTGLTSLDYAIGEYIRTKDAYAKHPEIRDYIVQLETILKDERTNRAVIVQELLKGDFLSFQTEWNEERRPVEAQNFTLNLCRALAAIHSIELYPRDLTPGNILYHFDPKDNSAHYKLCDFGLSSLNGQNNPLGPSVGGVYIRDVQSESDVLADLYATALNIILAYTGKQPFTQNNPRPGNSEDLEARREFENMIHSAKMDREGLDGLCNVLPDGIKEVAIDLTQPYPRNRKIQNAAALLVRVCDIYN